MITDSVNTENKSKEAPVAQCNFFVLRKKRPCRMTVRPGRQYCGEHEPQPKTDEGVADTRIPCPNDPKHTCYASKLEKHLSICNARPTELPEYIVPNVNIPEATEPGVRVPLSAVPKETLEEVINKVNRLYDKHVKDEIATLEELPIHWTVLEEFNDPSRTESSRRHLRQTSSLLHLLESSGLVQAGTCYVELGAGKGLVSYYAWQAWCANAAGSSALLVDRAALRHKRDNKLPRDTQRGDATLPHDSVARLRADLAHLALQHVPMVRDCQRIVGIAKHLCGVATDYALHCVTAVGVTDKARGVVVATCCHHRCEPNVFLGREYLQNLGITDEEFNVMLGIVSWATCGDGRPRGKRKVGEQTDGGQGEGEDEEVSSDGIDVNLEDRLFRARRASTGRNAKALLDAARAHALRGRGYDVTLVRFVPQSVSPENLAIVAVKNA